MRSLVLLVIFSARWLVGVVATTQAPLQVPYNTSHSIGPDGPWNFIYNPIDFPDQNLYFLASLTETTVIVPNAACQNQSAACPLPLPPLYQQSGAQETLAVNDSSEFDASTWDNISIPLSLVGSGHYIMDRITVDGNMIDGSGFVVADNFTIKFPSGSYYTQDVGLLSLNASGDGTLTWTTTSGSQHTANKTLPAVYASGVMSSISYGLHIGSASQNVTGSLYLGGYDSSRFISSPAKISKGNSLSLSQLSMDVSSGGSAFSNTTTNPLPISVLTSPTNALAIQLEPGLPYMYLPKATCDLIAAHLPITYNSGLNLYLWNTNASSQIQRLLSSPHYLSFDFNNNAATIAVPLALLNLTLTPPIVSDPTPYFPCSPYQPSDGQTYILGRAFLQGAFLAQNWQSETLWLAQAPGPSLPPADVKIIQPGDDTIGPMENPPTWEQTWKGVLTPLPGSANGGNSGSGGGGGGSSSGNGGLSTGVKAGIGVVVAVVGLVILAAVGILFWRRRRIATGRVKGEQVLNVTEINGNARYELRGDVGVGKREDVTPGSTQALASAKVHVVPQSTPAELEGNGS